WVLIVTGGQAATTAWGGRQLLVITFGAVSTLQSVLDGQRWISRQRQSLGVEIVVDFAVACRVPAPVVLDARRLLASLVIPQQMAHLVNEQRRVLLDGVGRHPALVVVEPPI